MRAAINSFLTDEGGATAIEYGLLAAAMGLAIVVMISQLGDQLIAKFALIEAALNR